MLRPTDSLSPSFAVLPFPRVPIILSPSPRAHTQVDKLQFINNIKDLRESGLQEATNAELLLLRRRPGPHHLRLTRPPEACMASRAKFVKMCVTPIWVMS